MPGSAAGKRIDARRTTISVCQDRRAQREYDRQAQGEARLLGGRASSGVVALQLDRVGGVRPENGRQAARRRQHREMPRGQTFDVGSLGGVFLL